MLAEFVFQNPSCRQSILKALGRILVWQFRKRVSNVPRRVTVGSCVFLAYPDSHYASRVVYSGGYPEFHEVKFLERFLRSGDTCIDIGANVGFYSVLMRSIVGVCGYVVSVEMGSVNRLREQIQANRFQNVTVIKSAVGAEVGYANLFETGEDCTCRVALDGETSSGNVPMTTLSELVGTYPDTLFVKMDIEGFEWPVLQGADYLLQNRRPPVIQVELAGYTKRYGASTSDVLGYCEGHGYRSAVYDGLKHELFFTDRHWEMGRENVLLIHEDSLPLVRNRLEG